MTSKDIYKNRDRVHALLYQSRINDAFEALDPMIQASGSWELREQVEQLQVSYRFMLQYLNQGILDPKRGEVLAHISGQLHLMVDRAAISLLEPESNEVFFVRRRELNNVSLEEIVHSHRAELNKFSLLVSVPAEQRDDAHISNVLTQRELHETAIFNKIWSTFPTPADDAELIMGLMRDTDYPAYAKSLIISALLLGLLRVYDERKVQLLMDTYTTSDVPMVQMRALVATLLSLKLHHQRVALSASLVPHARAMSDMPGFATDMATAQFQLARSRNTENITRRVNEDIMPGLMKLRPDVLRKMNETPIDMADLEANPEWQEMLENSGMAKKMEEFNEMQLDGSDVFITTFSRLKTFPFFQTLSNWFIPFHEENSVIYSVFNGDEAPLRMVVTRAPFLCDSDRYSFGLSLKSMPLSQRQLIVGQIKQQVEQVGEMQQAELPNHQRERERQANMYVQDLYRFFKLFSRRREFIPAFDDNMDFTDIPLLGRDACRPDALSLIAEFYFKNGFYDDAIKYYQYVLAETDNVDPHIFQKMGFCQQSLGHMQAAIEQYHRYELADERDLWTVKHMASCYRMLKDYDRAMEYYRIAEDLRPGTVVNAINMGHCLLEQGDTEGAMQFYFKADLMDDSKHRARRPIAWCSFLMKNDERSLDYYNRIISDDKPSAQDYLNRGHVLLAMHRISDAIVSYKNALKLMGGNVSALRDAFMADADTMQSRGIELPDLSLLIDAVATTINTNE